MTETTTNFVKELIDEIDKTKALCEKLAKANEKIEKEYEYRGLELKSALEELDRYIQKYGAIESENENA